MSLSQSVTLAIRLAIIREDVPMSEIAYRAGMKPNHFYSRMRKCGAWSMGELDTIANILFDGGVLELFHMAECEQKQAEVTA
jgi:DNA-binding ferritin-like protein (Dps family)